MHKKRGYERKTFHELHRDHKLFVIACEGSKTEPNYFRLFEYLSRRVTVDVIGDDEDSVDERNKSAPNWVLDRAITYTEEENLIEDDELWFVMDIDKWDEEQIRLIAQHCFETPNWNIVLSNPCFEVWLILHKKRDLTAFRAMNCRELKHELSLLERGGYNPLKFIPQIHEAILNAKDIDKYPEYFWPEELVTKVYQLCEAVFEKVAANEFDEFLTKTLPGLLRKS